MPHLALGAALLALFLWATRGGRPILKRNEWRLASGAFALAAFVGAVFVGGRGAWWEAIALIVLGLSLAGSARRGAPSARPSGGNGRMSLEDARSILGIDAEAGP